MIEPNGGASNQAEDRGSRDPETAPWITPSIEDLPRLEKLTLQTGAGLDPDEGFKYV